MHTMSTKHPLRMWNPKGDIERTPLSLWWQVPRHFDDEELNQILERDSLSSFEAVWEYCKDSFDQHMRSQGIIEEAEDPVPVEGNFLILERLSAFVTVNWLFERNFGACFAFVSYEATPTKYPAKKLAGRRPRHFTKYR